MRPLKVVLATVVYGQLSIAAPRILFPINAQVPPVARPSHPFRFTFAPSTFSTDLPNTYQLSSAPEWLSLDSETRTLYGTPTLGDANIQISITASDKTGSVTMNSELVVRAAQAPTVQIPLNSQPALFGTFSTPSTLAYYPSSHFRYQFSPDTFTQGGTNSTLAYYAVTQDNTPLPSWIVFDAKTLSLSGQTPDDLSLVQPPETFAILLIASDVEGFAGASIPFNITVGNHIMAFADANVRVKGEAGTAFEYKGLSDSLKLDGKVISAQNLSSVTARVPDWLNFDNSTFMLSGHPPENAFPCNVVVSVVDFYGDNASTQISIDANATLFSRSITRLNATVGQDFSYDFKSFLVDPLNVQLTAQFEPATSWLSFDPKSITLSGKVPNGTTPSTVRIDLHASSKTSIDSQSMSITLNVISEESQGSIATSSSTPSSTSRYIAATTTTTALDSSGSGENKSHEKKLSRGEIAAIVVPLVLLVLAASSCIFWCCCYHQSRRPGRAKSPSKSDISGPVPEPVPVSQLYAPAESYQTLPLAETRTSQIVPNDHAIYNEMTKKYRRSSMLRRSQTMSNLSGARSSYLAESNSSGTRGRSLSENAVSTDHSGNWTSICSGQFSEERRAQNSTPQASYSHSGRATRNFSRKTYSSGYLHRESSYNVHSGPSSTSRHSSIQQTPENNIDTTTYLPKISHFSHHPGTLILEEDLDGFQSDQPVHGTSRAELSPSTSAWSRDLNARYRESGFSAQTQDTNVLFSSNRSSKSKNGVSNGIRLVTPSPQAPSKAHLSTIEGSPRTLYKPSRSNGGGGFFLGGSRSSSGGLRTANGYPTSLEYISNPNSPALPGTLSASLSPANQLDSSFNAGAMSPTLHEGLVSSHDKQQSTLEKMVSAAGLRSTDDELIPDYHQNFGGLGIGHGKAIEGSNDGSLSHRLSILSHISNRVSRTFQLRNSKSSHGERDPESRFQEAEESDGTLRRHCGHERSLRGRSSERQYGREDASPGRSLGSSEYSRLDRPTHPPTKPRAAHVRDGKAEAQHPSRNSSKPRYSRGLPIEYYPDEESPTFGQGTLGEIQKTVMSGGGAAGNAEGDGGAERVSRSPVMVEVQGRSEAARERSLEGRAWGQAMPGRSEALGLGILGLRVRERNMVEGKRDLGAGTGGSRGKGPVGDGSGVGDENRVGGYGDGPGPGLRKGSAGARRYGYDDGWEGDVGGRDWEALESGSAFL